jgi:hypothetical protein
MDQRNEGIDDPALKEALHEAGSPPAEVSPELWPRIRSQAAVTPQDQPPLAAAETTAVRVRAAPFIPAMIVRWSLEAASVAASFAIGFFAWKIATVKPAARRPVEIVETPPPVAVAPKPDENPKRRLPTLTMTADRERVSLQEIKQGKIAVVFNLQNTEDVPLFLQAWPEGGRLDYPRYMLQVRRSGAAGEGEAQWLRLSRAPERIDSDMTGAEIEIRPGGRYVLHCDLKDLIKDEGTYEIYGVYAGPVRSSDASEAPRTYFMPGRSQAVTLVVTGE